ncbi:FxLYD domain-containing protein [Burkholderia cenocepacia]|uniref:FxLYD domain-containing protein n=1 Tax=Burkholderia cenocepacia TaxID=95486 RepID=UPI000F592910|nr:FxLYD domain-containing protein [Burkholderia cenocepacia]
MKRICVCLTSMIITAAAIAQPSQMVRITNTAVIPGIAPQISYVIGTAENVTNKTISAVSVTFNLYDRNNTLVGNASDVANNLPAGGAWKFKAIATTPFDHFTLSGITAY